MAENRSGLQKKVSTIFDGAPVPKAGDGQQPAITPLLAKSYSQQTIHEEDAMEVKLIRFRKNGQQKAFTLPSAVTVIGRRSNCDLRIPISSVSKKHCQINCDDGTLKIRDLGSKNGTLLNGVRINEALIQPGDWVQIGPIGFVFQINGQPEKVIAPAVKQPEKPKPKKEKAKEKTTAKAEAKAKQKTDADHFEKLNDSDVSAILDADVKDSSDASGAADILIDDSESLKPDSDLLLDDLDELKN